MAKFEIGQLVATPGALEVLTEARADWVNLLTRHASGDWGDVDEEDAATNDKAVLNGQRILSSYKVGPHKVWIITEADRSHTTILMPDEY